ncbi:hypothetical protein V6N13_081455 [Hibiscus sabdariffa]|uniref:Uncharacterized protein n=1 Tax=Hibiscus sabdariffa TaxID=183260 RepID=A0ABR2DC83_9ROSI
MGRNPCCSKEELNKGAWTALEDKLLISYIQAHGDGQWSNVPERAGLKRCGKSCRLRWLNYLRPDIKRGNISHDEEELIIRLHNLLGNRWALIAGRLPGRTDNEIKNYWNTTLGKKAKAQASIEASPGKYTKKIISTESGATEPSSSSQATKAKTEVIRTRATMCSSQVIFPLQLPASLDVDVTNFEESFDEAMFEDWTRNPCLNNNATTDIDEHRDSGLNSTVEAQVLHSLYSDGSHSLNSEVNLLKPSDGEFEEPFDEAMFKDWTADPCLNDNSTVGLESFAFLVDPDEWP